MFSQSSSSYPYYTACQSSQFRTDAGAFAGVSAVAAGNSIASSSSNAIDFSARPGYSMSSLFNSGLSSVGLGSAASHAYAPSTCATYGQTQTGLFGNGNWLPFVPYGNVASSAFMNQDATSTFNITTCFANLLYVYSIYMYLYGFLPFSDFGEMW